MRSAAKTSCGMSLTFEDDQLEWIVYTSRMGQQAEPSQHMQFTATRSHTEFAEAAAETVGFPEYEANARLA